MTIAVTLTAAVAAASAYRAWCIWKLAQEAMKEG